MSIDIHKRLLDHYRNRNKPIKGPQIESIVRKAFVKKTVETEDSNSLSDVLKNEAHITHEAEPLDFRSLPRALLVYFPGPPKPPPKLEEVPYTYEIVPPVKFSMPKQKPGYVGEWVLETGGFRDKKSQSFTDEYIDSTPQKKYQNPISQRSVKFRSIVKSLVAGMNDKNLTLHEIIRNKGLIKKPFGYHDSVELFRLAKEGELAIENLLKANPMLAFDVDGQHMTALHWASRFGHTALVKLLIETYRSNVHAKDSFGRIALHHAVQQRNIECTIRLFVEGSKTTAKDNSGKTVKELAPDDYMKFLLDKLDEVRFMVRSQGHRDYNIYKQKLEESVRAVLDTHRQYF